jgi:tripartite-type tricarboxylate transporter receptor subunit TctC
VVARVDALTREVLALPEVQSRLLGIGAEPMPMPAEEFATYLRSEIERWTGVVQAARIVLD